MGWKMNKETSKRLFDMKYSLSHVVFDSARRRIDKQHEGFDKAIKILEKRKKI